MIQNFEQFSYITIKFFYKTKVPVKKQESYGNFYLVKDLQNISISKLTMVRILLIYLRN
jgi:hypothetical protein